MSKQTILLFTFIFALLGANCQNTKNIKTVENFELQKYLGKWYEIARFDHSFEKGLVGVTATYTLEQKGFVKVLNEGYKNTLDGKHSIAVGKAKIPDKSCPSKLKVSFFLFFYADYNILELDKDYQWAIVGSNSDNYLWILSRTPHLDNTTYQMLLDKAKSHGYDLTKLIKVEQK